jgi:hypothetical protein
MPDQPGRRARWTVAGVLAPGTAAVFSVAVAWAAHATPTTASKPVLAAVPPQVRTVPDRAAALAARRALAGNRAEVAYLDHLLATLTDDTVKLQAAERAATRPPAMPNLPPVIAQRPAPAPLPVVVPAPAQPPPPVHVTTGASGTKR